MWQKLYMEKKNWRIKKHQVIPMPTHEARVDSKPQERRLKIDEGKKFIQSHVKRRLIFFLG